MPSMQTTTAQQSLSLRVEAEQIARLYEPPDTGEHSLLGDEDTVQRILAALQDGNYRETACNLAGISKQTLYNWIKKADQGHEAAKRFVDAMEKAEAMAEAETVHHVRDAASKPQFWAAGMTWLERKSPDKWGRRPDDSSSPKVVVQIGARDSDVQVTIQTDTSDTGR